MGLFEDPQHGTGLAIISVDQAAENAIIVVSGANMAIDESDVARALEFLPGCSVLLLQLEVPLEASRQLAGAAHGRGVTVILDPAPAKPLDDDLLGTLDYHHPQRGRG